MATSTPPLRLLDLRCSASAALLAMRQDSEALAWLVLAGAFFAPALASSGGNPYQILFGHFLLLDLFIVAISSRTGWRTLNLLGFFLTTLFGLGAGAL